MRRRFRYAARCAFAAAVVTGLLALGSPGCRTATQVTVEIRVSGITCDQLKGVAIVVAKNPAEAEDRLAGDQLSAQIPSGQCGSDPFSLGTLVLTPSGSTGAIAVRARVREGADAKCMRPDYRGCIVSRRSFAFVDHTSVALPITLEIACADVPCEAMTSCRSGQCVSSTADCAEGRDNCGSGAEPGDPGGGEGGAPADGPLADATLQDGPGADASRDGAPDADADAAPEAGTGNTCPRAASMGGPVDCFNLPSAHYCCRKQATSTFFCGQPGANCFNVDDAFACTGRRLCARGEYCCAPPTATGMPRTSACSSSCPPFGGHFLCNTSVDCPGGKPCTVNYVYMSAGGGPLKECEP